VPTRTGCSSFANAIVSQMLKQWNTTKEVLHINIKLKVIERQLKNKIADSVSSR